MPAPSPGNREASAKRVEEALAVLRALGMPDKQLNERSELTLLALLDLAPNASWKAATNPLRGITPIMEFINEQYGKKYAPNTRESIHRESVHQFLAAGLIVANPDDPQRATNNKNFAYQIESSVLELVRTYRTSTWGRTLKTYLASVETLKKRYAQEREMLRIPIEVEPGRTITLSPGNHNILIEQIMQEFAPRFIPGGKLLYIGDTGDKFAYFDKDALSALGVEMNAHGKMPDVIIHHSAKGWLFLIEAVTSHGPINPKRQAELQTLFSASTAGLVFVTAFLSRKAMVAYLLEISWETEIWVSEVPTHMMHLNGDRFLGPYGNKRERG